MANNKQQPPTILTILSIGPPLEHETDPDDEEEEKRKAIRVEVIKFYEVWENSRRRGTNYFHYLICHKSGWIKLLKGLMSFL